MSGRDKSGPLGAGPQTGRGAGNCGGIDRPGSVTVGSRGVGSRWRGRRNRQVRGSGGRRPGGRGWRGRGGVNLGAADGLDDWRVSEEPAPSLDEPAVSAPAASATTPLGAPTELAELRQLTLRLTRSLEQLERRLAELESRDRGAR